MKGGINRLLAVGMMALMCVSMWGLGMMIIGDGEDDTREP